MSFQQISFHAHPTSRQLVVTRMRIFMGTFAGVQFVLGGLFGPPLLWVTFRAYTGAPWPATNNFILIVGPAMAIGMLALSGFGGIRNPHTRAYLQHGARYQLDSEDLSIQGHEASSVVKWSVVTGATEYKDLFVLRMSNSIHLLPKADLPGEAAASLRDLLKYKLGKKAKLRPD